MKKKLTTLIAAFAMALCSALVCLACAGGSDSGKTDEPEDNTPLPTKTEIVAARQVAVAEPVQGYDFTLTFKGDFSILGIGAALEGKYDGAYRYDGHTDSIVFKRTTSGALLFDSTAYVISSGDSLIKMTMDGAKVKKLSVELPEEKNITMINLPVVNLVNSIKEANIQSVKALKNSKYSYSCPVSLDGSNPACSVVNQVFEKLGTGVSFKGIKLKANASTLDFNMTDDKIDTFRFGFQMEVEVKSVKVAVRVEYSQKHSSSTITPPTDTSGIVYAPGDVAQEVNAINAAIADLKDDPVYSLDLTAKNAFDPGWSKLAITDSYTARMFKNTDDAQNAWFNHSYCYKAHSEEAGKESYKYTLGNVNGDDENNRGTWLISRKSSNTQTKEENVTADTQFDFLTSMVKLNANEIDCVKKKTDAEQTVYTVYLNRAGTTSVQKKIADMINTNNYGDVIPVNNYFSADNIVKDAEIEVVLTNGKITSVKCKTKLCYTPTGGDYTEYNITLDNSIELLVNKNYDKAEKYKAPTKVKGSILGFGKNLNDSEYYIL
ncbi:MAG: hypothetical protein J1G38_00315 [Clostridiales bacterium]|nr:hypothetical protein [Clostridiales bacterium]